MPSLTCGTITEITSCGNVQVLHGVSVTLQCIQTKSQFKRGIFRVPDFIRVVRISFHQQKIVLISRFTAEKNAVSCITFLDRWVISRFWVDEKELFLFLKISLYLPDRLNSCPFFPWECFVIFSTLFMHGVHFWKFSWFAHFFLQSVLPYRSVFTLLYFLCLTHFENSEKPSQFAYQKYVFVILLLWCCCCCLYSILFVGRFTRSRGYCDYRGRFWQLWRRTLVCITSNYTLFILIHGKSFLLPVLASYTEPKNARVRGYQGLSCSLTRKTLLAGKVNRRFFSRQNRKIAGSNVRNPHLFDLSD